MRLRKILDAALGLVLGTLTALLLIVFVYEGEASALLTTAIVIACIAPPAYLFVFTYRENYS